MTDSQPRQHFNRIALLGLGLIGSSLARVIKQNQLAGHIAGWTRSAASRERAAELALADSLPPTPQEAVAGADLVVLCTPLSAFVPLARQIAPALAPGALVSDVGSVKMPVARDLPPLLPASVHLLPAHPVAGTEQSGPAAGFASLFANRPVILTPLASTPAAKQQQLAAFWQACGAKIYQMTAEKHDRLLALTSHAPHLIAYALVHAALDSRLASADDAAAFSAGGFRDFTRVAASDPVMWRDIFLANDAPVLAALAEIETALAQLKKSISEKQGDRLAAVFAGARQMRRRIIEAGQETSQPDFGRPHSSADNKR